MPFSKVRKMFWTKVLAVKTPLLTSVLVFVQPEAYTLFRGKPFGRRGMLTSRALLATLRQTLCKWRFISCWFIAASVWFFSRHGFFRFVLKCSYNLNFWFFFKWNYSLFTHLIDHEVQRRSLGSARKHIVARLRNTVAHQEVSLLLDDLFRPLPWYGTMVPGVRSKVPRI